MIFNFNLLNGYMCYGLMVIIVGIQIRLKVLMPGIFMYIYGGRRVNKPYRANYENS